MTKRRARFVFKTRGRLWSVNGLGAAFRKSEPGCPQCHLHGLKTGSMRRLSGERHRYELMARSGHHALAVIELFQSRRRPRESRRQRKRQRKWQPLPGREWQTHGLEAGAKALAFRRGGGLL
jgi:hypothetical protein